MRIQELSILFQISSRKSTADKKNIKDAAAAAVDDDILYLYWEETKLLID